MSEIDEEKSLLALANTIKLLRESGVTVVIVAPPPSSKRDMSVCVERKIMNLVTFNTNDCSISKASDTLAYDKELRLLATLSEISGTNIVDLRDYLCEDDKCITSLNNVPLYRDSVHLSFLGSAEIGKMFDLSSILTKTAR